MRDTKETRGLLLLLFIGHFKTTYEQVEIVKTKSRTLRMGASNPTELKCVFLPAQGYFLVGLSENLEVFRFAFWGVCGGS